MNGTGFIPHDSDQAGHRHRCLLPRHRNRDSLHRFFTLDDVAGDPAVHLGEHCHQWNLVFGVAGIFSLAQMAVFTMGGYTAAMLSLYMGCRSG